MLISNNELKKNNINLEIETLKEKLIQLGHEVEEVIEYKNELLVTGKVIDIEKHPDADKLNICKVDVGNEILQIVCGAPNVGKDQFVIVACVGCQLGEDFKIKRSKIRGVESNGMICSLAEIGLSSNVLTSEDTDGIYNFANKVELGKNALKELGLKDEILDLGLTANRGDCLSYDGVIRDLNALLNVKNKVEEVELEVEIDNPYNVNNLDDENTLFLTSLLLKNVEIKSVPNEIKIFLAKHNIKAQNNIVDFANYVMLQTGVPLHTYDADKIKESLTVCEVEKEEKFEALDESIYNLKPGTLVIKDAEKTVAIASVIGSNATKVTNDTKNVLVEIGNFDSVKVRKSAACIGKKTDASMRGEKGIDPLAVLKAYKLMIELTTKDSNVVVSDVNFSNDLYFKQKMITLDYYNVERILGVIVELEEVKDILARLMFELVKEEDGYLQYLVPSHRFDIFNDHDLIEEIIRIYGINNVKKMKEFQTFTKIDSVINEPSIKIEREIEKLLLANNLNQVITYSLVSEEELIAFNGDIQKAVSLMMPLSNLRQYYRQSLIPSLLEVAKYNLDRQAEYVNYFEIGNRYFEEEDQTREELLVAGIMGGNIPSYYSDNKRTFDFYDLKASVEALLNYYNLDYDFIQSEDSFDQVNKYSNADIYIKNKKVGFIGLKHPNYFKKIKPNIYMFELNLSLIIELLDYKVDYKKVSMNPSVTRDLTFNALREVPFSEITQIFNKIGYLKDYKLKDLYNGENIENGYVAYTFSLEFSSNEETLTNELVDNSINKIIKKAIELGMVFNNA